jgi:CHAT domain-containing protein
MQRFYQNLLGKGKGEGAKPMSKVQALQEAKKWLRELSNEEALKEVAELKDGVVRGKERGEIKVTNRLDPKAPAESRPFAHPKFWSAFLLLGEPE